MEFLRVLENGSLPQVEEAISARLAKNSSFFKQNNPKFYRLLTREPAFYQLYIGEDGLNIYNIQNKNFVYPIREGKHSLLAVAKQYASNPLGNPLWRFYNNRNKIEKMDEERFKDSAAIQNKIIDFALENENLHIGVAHLPQKTLPMTTVLGLGAGLFLEYVLENYDYIHSLLIFEESYDFFRISCCFIDYEKMFNRLPDGALYLFVEDILDRKLLKTFFSRRRITSNYIRLEVSSYSTPKLEEVKKVIELEQNSNARGWGTFEDEMIGVRNSKINLKLKNGRIKHKILSKREKQNIPLCVVGNGPSLDELLPFLKANSENLIIFSCGTALKPLVTYGIKPDFQIELERLPFLKGILEESGIGDIPLLGANIVDSSTLESAKESYIFMRGSAAPTYLHKPKFILEDSFPFVGNAGLSLALQFANEVYLCGLDMGYKKGRSKHAKNSYYGEESNDLPSDAILTKGNFSDDIYSTPLFALSREFAEVAILKNRDSKVYNLSDGAYISGATPLVSSKAKFKKIDKKSALDRIKSCFSDDPTVLGNLEEGYEKKSFEEIRRELTKLIGAPVAGKRELYIRMDEAYSYIERLKSKNPAFGILLGGSFMHILDTMFTALLHIKRDKIAEPYAIFANIFIKGLDLFESRYNFSALLSDME